MKINLNIIHACVLLLITATKKKVWCRDDVSPVIAKCQYWLCANVVPIEYVNFHKELVIFNPAVGGGREVRGGSKILEELLEWGWNHCKFFLRGVEILLLCLIIREVLYIQCFVERWNFYLYLSFVHSRVHSAKFTLWK